MWVQHGRSRCHDLRLSALRLVDRREAIVAACSAATGGDIVVVAGKGHETKQVLADRTVDFDDIAVTRETLWNL